MRAWLTLAHRYVGLVLAGFLFVAGLTGAALAWNHELDAAINAGMMKAAPPSPDAPAIDPLQIRERIAARDPEAQVNWMDLSPAAGEARLFLLTWPDAARENADNEVYADPYTGAVLGSRRWGNIRQGMVNLMPFLYRLHHSLALGTIGTYAFGIVALLWKLDCFVGAWLTMPARFRRTGSAPDRQPRKRWTARWWPAWKVRWHGGATKLNVDLHRAGGLWPWAMLFVLAWSSVGFNLKEVYQPVMHRLFERQNELAQRQPLPAPQAKPGMSWFEAREIGRDLIAREAQQNGVAILEERGLSYEPARALFRYRVLSDRDVTLRWGVTSVYFDANDGRRIAAHLPTGKAAGDTVDHWLSVLHMAAVWGAPFQAFITLLGFGVAMLSVTGLVIWQKKRQARHARSGLIDRSVHHRQKPAS